MGSAAAALGGTGKGPYGQAGGAAVCAMGAGAGVGGEVVGTGVGEMGDFTAAVTSGLKWFN